MVTLKRLSGPDTAAPPPGDPEAVESLESIAREVESATQAEATAAAPAQQAQQQAQAQAHQAEAAAASKELLRVLIVGRNMGARLASATNVLTDAKVHEIWSDAQLAELVDPLMAVMDRHGDDINAFFEKFGPYVMLAVAAGMPAWATLTAVREHKANTINVTSRVVPDPPTPGTGGAAGG